MRHNHAWSPPGTGEGVLHMVLADIGGAISITAAIVGIIAGVVALAPGGRKLVASIWARLTAHRRRLTAVEARVDTFDAKVLTLESDFQTNYAALSPRVNDSWRMLQEIRTQLADLEQRVADLRKDSDQLRQWVIQLHRVDDPNVLVGIDDVLPRIDLLATKVADLERRTGGRPLSRAEVTLQQHAELKHQLGEDGSLSDSPKGR
jgi:hypothetical protein